MSQRRFAKYEVSLTQFLLASKDSCNVELSRISDGTDVITQLSFRRYSFVRNGTRCVVTDPLHIVDGVCKKYVEGEHELEVLRRFENGNPVIYIGVKHESVSQSLMRLFCVTELLITDDSVLLLKDLGPDVRYQYVEGDLQSCLPPVSMSLDSAVASLAYLARSIGIANGGMHNTFGEELVVECEKAANVGEKTEHPTTMPRAALPIAVSSYEPFEGGKHMVKVYRNMRFWNAHMGLIKRYKNRLASPERFGMVDTIEINGRTFPALSVSCYLSEKTKDQSYPKNVYEESLAAGKMQGRFTSERGIYVDDVFIITNATTIGGNRLNPEGKYIAPTGLPHGRFLIHSTRTWCDGKVLDSCAREYNLDRNGRILPHVYTERGASVAWSEGCIVTTPDAITYLRNIVGDRPFDFSIIEE